MKIPKFVKLLTVIAIVIGSLALIYDHLVETEIWRYKITVSVDTPEGVKTGSAVREIKISYSTIGSGPEAGPSKESKGEAIVVDLGKHGVLFALTSFGDYGSLYAAHPDFRDNGISFQSETVTLSEKAYPLLVRFRDINDPKTVERVDPDNLVASFGEGVRLNSVTLAMTDEPVTREIEKWLPWLPYTKEGSIDGKSTGGRPELSNRLDHGHFKR